MGIFLLIRHAQSTWNASGRWQGQANPPLSPIGEAQVAAAARHLGARSHRPFDLVVTSDLDRAARTADLLMEHLGQAAPTVREPVLREFDVGEWSGLTREEIDARWPGTLERFDQRRPVTPVGGEERAAFDARVIEASQTVATLAATREANHVLVVSHGGVIRSLARSLGLDEHHIGHLSGYRGDIGSSLQPRTRVDLLEVGDPGRIAGGPGVGWAAPRAGSGGAAGAGDGGEAGEGVA